MTIQKELIAQLGTLTAQEAAMILSIICKNTPEVAVC